MKPPVISPPANTGWANFGGFSTPEQIETNTKANDDSWFKISDDFSVMTNKSSSVHSEKFGKSDIFADFNFEKPEPRQQATNDDQTWAFFDFDKSSKK